MPEHDVDAIILTDDDKQDIREEHAYIAARIAGGAGADLVRDLMRYCDHLNNELAAGRRLPIDEVAVP